MPLNGELDAGLGADDRGPSSGVAYPPGGDGRRGGGLAREVGHREPEHRGGNHRAGTGQSVNGGGVGRAANGRPVNGRPAPGTPANGNGAHGDAGAGNGVDPALLAVLSDTGSFANLPTWAAFEPESTGSHRPPEVTEPEPSWRLGGGWSEPTGSWPAIPDAAHADDSPAEQSWPDLDVPAESDVSWFGGLDGNGNGNGDGDGDGDGAAPAGDVREAGPGRSGPAGLLPGSTAPAAPAGPSGPSAVGDRGDGPWHPEVGRTGWPAGASAAPPPAAPPVGAGFTAPLPPMQFIQPNNDAASARNGATPHAPADAGGALDGGGSGTWRRPRHSASGAEGVDPLDGHDGSGPVGAEGLAEADEPDKVTASHRTTVVLRYVLGRLAVDQVRRLTRGAALLPLVGLGLLAVQPRWIGAVLFVLGVAIMVMRRVTIRKLERLSLADRFRPVEDELRGAVEAGKASLRVELRRVALPSRSWQVPLFAMRLARGKVRAQAKAKLREVDVDRVLPRAQLVRALRVLDDATTTPEQR